MPIISRAATLPEVVRWRSERQSAETAVIFLADGEEDEQRLTYAELHRRAAAIAAALSEAGAAGSRALLVYDSGLDYIAALYGCFYAGVVAVPVYPPDPFRVDRTLPRLQAIVNDAGASCLLATAETLQWTKPLFAGLPGLKLSLATDELTANMATGQATLPPLPQPDQPALLQYTSGSTGVARGVTITHANLLANLRSIHANVDRENNILVLWLPVYHDMGLIGGIFQPVFSGRLAVLMSPISFMQRPVRWLNAITRYRGTVTAAPNFAYDLCVRKLTADDRKELDLSSLRTALNGAEIIRPETIDRFSATFAECGFRREAFLPCYGLAEATLMVAGCAVEKPPVARSFSAADMAENRAVAAADGSLKLVGCGQAVLGQRVAIVDPDSLQPLESGQVGEIWVAGESIGQGYWNHPQESDATFRAALADGSGPYLRTGDLGFFDDGELFIAGRRKELIIIQGRNHYPHDVEETVWRAHPLLKADGGAAFSIDVGGEERLAVVQEVIRPKKANLNELIERVRSQVAEVHGVPPAAVALIPAGTLPKTSSGKTRRRGCREQFLSGDLPMLAEWRDEGLCAGGKQAKAAAVAPQTETEQKLAAIWSEVLGVEVRDVQANFFDLGGQSLLAGQLAARVQEAFAVDLPLRTLFANPTIATLAAWLDAPAEKRQADALPPVTRADRSRPLPLSSSQEQLWFLEQLEREPRYNLAAGIRLHGPLDVPALERSLATILARHEALRTCFPAVDGVPRQVVDAEVVDAVGRLAKPSFTVGRLAKPSLASGGPAGRPTDGDGLASRPTENSKFNLATGPLLEVALARVSDGEYQLNIRAHHLICDGWSLAILLRELTTLYGDLANQGPSASSTTLDDVDWHYADFAVWQCNCLATPQLAKQLEYWKRQLEGVEPLNLIADYHRGADTAFRGASVEWTIDKPLAEALTLTAQREGATLYMALLTAFQILLGRYARQHDVCVGSPISYRPRREFEQSIGYFVNTLALRTDLSGELTFRQLLAHVRETVLDALAHGDAPLRAVVDAVAPRREAGRTPFFNVMFVFENLPWQAREAAGVTFGEIEIDHTRIGSYDLGLVIEEQAERLKASFVYNAELFNRETITAMAAAFRTLLGGLAADADAPVMRLPLIAGAEHPPLASDVECPPLVICRERPPWRSVNDQMTSRSATEAPRPAEVVREVKLQSDSRNATVGVPYRVNRQCHVATLGGAADAIAIAA
ncbi:MAG TPA: condensation domain-containing protein, partial [Pirellulales bacterium]